MKPVMSGGVGHPERVALRAWAAPFDRALGAVSRDVRLLAAVTPTNAAIERRRLEESFARGGAALPRWIYRRADVDGTARALSRLDNVLAAESAPLADLYRARVRELARELAIVGACGTPALCDAARARFPDGDAAARALAEALAAHDDHDESESVVSDDASDPRSLLARLRALVGRERLAFRIEVRDDLYAAAATGDDTIYVARGRRLTPRDADRIALHEVYGHAAPRARAKSSGLGLLSIGTAGGADDQEGYALVLEERAGYLVGARARELAARHATVERMRRGADFVEATRALIAGAGLDATGAVRVAERVYRGGDGRSAGLGREVVYLPAFIRVKGALAAEATSERVLASGQVATEAIAMLRSLVDAA